MSAYIGRSSRPSAFSPIVTSMHAIERKAKLIEWRRYSGQMREPSLIRFCGILKMSDVDDSMMCIAMHARLKRFAPKPMSVGPTCVKR